MNTYRVKFLIEDTISYRTIRTEEIIEDNDMLEEVISSLLVKALWDYYKEWEITILDIKLFVESDNKAISNSTYEDSLC